MKILEKHDEKMLVCFFGMTRYNHPLNVTVEKKFQALAKLGTNFVVGFSTDICPRRFSQHAHFYLLPKLPMRLLRYGLMFTVGLLLALWFIMRHDVRILVTQSPYEGFTMALAKIIARLLGRQVILVVESHGDFEESLFLYHRLFFPKLYRFLIYHTARFTFQHTDLLRAVSQATQQQLDRWVLDKPKIQFSTWTDIETFLQTRSKHDKKFNFDILYAGALTPLKGIHYLVNAFANLANDFPNVQLILVGHTEDQTYVTKLKTQIQQLDLHERVQFVGQIPQTQLATKMHQACVFVLPSLSEGLGRVIVEAMATSTPVIGSRVGGIPEIIEDGVTGFLIPSSDEVALTKKLRWILEHPTEAQEMGIRGKIFAKQFFSTKTYVQGYKQIFDTAQKIL